MAGLLNLGHLQRLKVFWLDNKYFLCYECRSTEPGGKEEKKMPRGDLIDDGANDWDESYCIVEDDENGNEVIIYEQDY